MEIKIFIIVMSFLCHNKCLSQKDDSTNVRMNQSKCFCDSIGVFTYVDVDALFGINEEESTKSQSQIFPLIEYFDRIKNKELLATDFPVSTKIKLIIDSLGNPIPFTINGKSISDVSKLNSLELKYLELIETMPKWKPAICNGKKVKSYYVIPHTLTIE